MDNKMNKNKLDYQKYQVLLLGACANIPFIFATHHWFVINKFGKLSRWEVLRRKDINNKLGYHLYKDRIKPLDGFQVFPFLSKPQWRGSILHIFEGDEAKTIANFIEASPHSYPFCNTYSLKGPNSNSYVQWVLNNVKASKVTLPWTAFGKNYKFPLPKP